MDKSSAHRIYEFDDFRIDVDHLMLSHQGREISLVPKAVETLVVLIEHRGKIVSKDELLQAVWRDTVVEESNLFLYLSVLRKTLGNQQNGGPYIETLRRRGYRFNGEVHLLREGTEDEFTGPVADDFGPSRANPITNAGQVYFVKDWDRRVESSSGAAAAPALKAVESYENLTTEENESESAAFSSGNDVSEKSRQAGEVARALLPTKTERLQTSKTHYVIAFSLAAILLTVILAGSYWRSRRVLATNATPKSMAILPFRPLTNENRDEILEFGMADTLITRLNNNRAITVRPLSSVLHFRNPDRDAVKAGRALNVEAVLDASIQRVGDRIHVNVNLFRIADGSATWSDSFDEKSTDVLALQNTMAARIASALALNLFNDEGVRKQKQYTYNADAADYYRRARYNELKLSEEGLRQALVFYQQAIEADPNYALAYAHMANTYRALGAAGFERLKDVSPHVRRLASRAMELDGSLVEAHVQLASLDRDPTSAETKFKRAIELGATDPQAHMGYAFVLASLKRVDEAIAEARRARELAPMTLIILALESDVLLRVGRPEEAIRQAKKTLDFDSNFWVARYHLGRAYAHQKRYTEAITEFEKAKELAPQSRLPIIELAATFAEMGNKEKAHEILGEMKRAFKPDAFPLISIASIHSVMGEKDSALDLLEKAVEVSDEPIQGIKNGKRFDNLRSEERFINLLRRIDSMTQPAF